MVSQIVLVLKAGTQRRTQPPTRPRTKVILSAEARAVLKLNQRKKANKFRTDLNNASQKLDQMTKTIAAKHHKSIRRVENDLYIGHTKLRSRRHKINAWNAFCWKMRGTKRVVNDENGM